MNFKKLNIITGWAVFIIATLTYVLTMEPTASFWDCGEFIASAFKLEVGHPPGAPLFMLIGNFFGTFAFGNLSKVAMMINLQAVLSSSFTILFLFWSITHIAKKLVAGNSQISELETGQKIVILGSGIVGALAYTFSDTFWFSAVESEVYAMSSLFTAVVFWAILKWENVADQKYANKWLILIAYLMGLSIGVHLLNLLAIPAIVLVFYFKKYDFSVKGLISALVLSFLLVVILMYGVIQGLVLAASWFELFFVNNLGMPFNSGFIIYLVLLVAGVVAGLYFTQKFQKPILNTIFLSFTVIIIGYSSFALIMIRSAANTPMDENNPENAFSLKSYLNREQYGDRPLMYGEYFNAEPVSKENNYTYIQVGDKYEQITKTNPTYEYDPEFCTIFPRMYSSTSSHVTAYKEWGNITTDDTQTPSFGSNILFFMKYQVGYMYLRYFMWNFSGRQNDEQGHGGYSKGNWITGISFLDAVRLGPQTDLPDSVKNHKSRNKYYLLPFILGLMGLIYSASNSNRDFWIVFALFFMTGLAIVLYLNQTPYQPRERDYAYAGSFYAFAIWIGLGVIPIYNALKKIRDSKVQAIIATVIAVIIPFQMAAENWDDHNRSGRYTARDFAANYLNSCAENAILFTYGDNDTFPLWYAQEVEGIRTDIRVVNLSLLSTDWYVDQMRRKAYESDTLPISFTPDQYVQGKRDIAPLYDVAEYLFNEKFEANFDDFESDYISYYNKLIEILEDSKFPELHSNDYKLLVDKGYSSIDALKFFTIINTLNDPATALKYEINKDSLTVLKVNSDKLLTEISQSYAPISAVIDFVASDESFTKVPYGDTELDFIPTTKFLMPVDKDKVVLNGTVSEKDKNQIVDAIKWTISDSYILKSNIIVLDILAHNNWERPIYFATSVGDENYMGLQEYFQLEGFAYRLVPIKTPKTEGDIARIDADILYDNVMNKFTWGRVNEDDVLVDSYIQRVISIMDIRNVFHRLSSQLMSDGDTIRAVEVLDKCFEVLPDNKYAFDYMTLPMIENYYLAGENEKANEIIRTMAGKIEQELKYYSKLSSRFSESYSQEEYIASYILGELVSLAQNYEQEDLMMEIFPVYSTYVGSTSN